MLFSMLCKAFKDCLQNTLRMLTTLNRLVIGLVKLVGSHICLKKVYSNCEEQMNLQQMERY